MARQKGIIKLKGTMSGITFVDSAVYGAHTRAARGTHTEAKINEVMQGNANHASEVGALGSPVLKQLKAIEKGFVPGDLWPRMTGKMFKAKSMRVHDLLESFKGIELNERYACSKLFSALPSIALTIKKRRLVPEVKLSSQPRFSRGLKASHYLYELCLLFLDGKGSCVMDRMETEWISFDEEPDVYGMEFVIPTDAKYFLIVEGVKGGRGGREIESFEARGYRICAWGKC